jgi:hypothetical protein
MGMRDLVLIKDQGRRIMESDFGGGGSIKPAFSFPLPPFLYLDVLNHPLFRKRTPD